MSDQPGLTKQIQHFRSGCPINHSVEMFGDGWSLMIIRDMLFWGKTTYGDFMQSPEKISTNMLATRLEQLLHRGLIEKWPDTANRKKFVYLLTDKGMALAPVLVEMLLWGADQSTATDVPKSFIEKLRSDREGVLAPIIAGYRQRKAEFLAES